MIGVVIPTYNRCTNLELLLKSLENQHYTNFEVVVADDGSTDGTRVLIEQTIRTPFWKHRLKYVCCGPHKGVRTGRARNFGAANLSNQVQLLVMLDSDLVLPTDLMTQFNSAHKCNPNLVIFGKVEWLPPLDNTTLSVAIANGGLNKLRDLVPKGFPVRVQGTFVGPELRTSLYDNLLGQAVVLRPEWALPLNSAWPINTYWKIGGFDETIIGYGYQDMDLGARAASMGVQCIACPDIWSLHVWHPKDNVRMIENQRNLDLYIRRHGPNQVIETDIDWTLWWHYHLERGGRVFRNDEQLWAVNSTGKYRLALSDFSWVAKLGHCIHCLSEININELTNSQDCGIAYDPFIA